MFLLHEKEMLNQLKPKITLERAKGFISDQSGLEARINFAEMREFPTTENGCFSANESYSFSTCEADHYDQVRFVMGS